MRAARLLLVLVYVGYLVNVGLVLLLLPWTQAWGRLVMQLPLAAATVLDAPAVRGSLSGFGFLHLALVALELVVAPSEHAEREHAPHEHVG